MTYTVQYRSFSLLVKMTWMFSFSQVKDLEAEVLELRVEKNKWFGDKEELQTTQRKLEAKNKEVNFSFLMMKKPIVWGYIYNIIIQTINFSIIFIVSTLTDRTHTADSG